LPEVVFNNEQRRPIYGNLLYTVTNSKSNSDLTNLVQFEIGRSLSESDLTFIEKEIANVPDNVEIQHNNNLFDFADMGLTDDEISDLENKSRTKFNNIRLQLAITNTEFKSVQNSIVSYNKSLTQVNDAIVALNLLDDDNDDLLTKFTNKKSDIEQELANLTLREQELSATLSTLYDDMIKLGLLVR